MRKAAIFNHPELDEVRRIWRLDQARAHSAEVASAPRKPAPFPSQEIYCSSRRAPIRGRGRSETDDAWWEELVRRGLPIEVSQKRNDTAGERRVAPEWREAT